MIKSYSINRVNNFQDKIIVLEYSKVVKTEVIDKGSYKNHNELKKYIKEQMKKYKFDSVAVLTEGVQNECKKFK